MALGLTEIKVRCRPRVTIISMGDEVAPPWDTPDAGQIRDINTYTLAALVSQAGGEPITTGLLRDDFEEVLLAARQALPETDVLVISAGSSVSARDLTADVIQSLGPPGVLVHGLALRPGKPAIGGLVEGKPVFGLPGNPVSAMVVFDLLVKPTLRYLRGEADLPEAKIAEAQLAQEIASAPGREDHVPVQLVRDGEGWVAQPVFGKSGLIYTLIRADGMIRVPPDVSGLYAGERVPVRLFHG
jgi:molybdopterin molybdotransferase